MKRADWTALMLACTKSNMDVIRILIEEGAAASLSMRNKDGWTCFHLACRQGQADIIAYLLALQPQIWQTTSRNGRTPLHTAGIQNSIQFSFNLPGGVGTRRCKIYFFAILLWRSWDLSLRRSWDVFPAIIVASFRFLRVSLGIFKVDSFYGTIEI